MIRNSAVKICFWIKGQLLRVVKNVNGNIYCMKQEMRKIVIPLLLREHRWTLVLLNFLVSVHTNDQIITECFGLPE